MNLKKIILIIVLIIIVVSVIVAILFVLYYRKLFLITFDEEFAKSSGLKSRCKIK